MSNIHTYPNQKIIHINKRHIYDNDIRVGDIYKNDVLQACRSLTESGFKLYIYLLLNQHDYNLGLSMTDATKQTGLGTRSYYRAVKELIDKAYLVPTHETMATDTFGNVPIYNFYSCNSYK